jgi:hypothetical protein
MRLYLINPSNPLVTIVNVKESRWNRYRVWKPLGLMVLRLNAKAYANFKSYSDTIDFRGI